MVQGRASSRNGDLLIKRRARKSVRMATPNRTSKCSIISVRDRNEVMTINRIVTKSNASRL